MRTWLLKSLFVLLTLCSARWGAAQQYFQVEIDTASFNNLPGLHSFAFASYNDYWLLTGGWKRGLHGFYPTNAFPNTGRNDSAFVINKTNGMVYKTHLNQLPQPMYQALTTTNAEFIQDDTVLYVVGGYGWNFVDNSHITYNSITAINIPSFINAVINGNAVSPYVRQTTHNMFRVAGGHLEKTDSTYYLVFGHRFDGYYNLNPGGLQQAYSNSIRKFRIDDDGTTLQIDSVTSITDTINFHRRDFNLVPQIFPNGDFGFTAFTGVFQYGIDLPYLNTIDITATDTFIRNNVTQYLNQYHTAVLPIYDSTNNYMHTCFFGGIGLYWVDQMNVLHIDSLVPFVNTISRMTRDPLGVVTESIEDMRMPGFYGTNAYFIPNDNFLYTHKKILSLDSLPMGKSLVGWIYGGIEADQPNVAYNTTLSRPSNILWEVYINKGTQYVPEKVVSPFTLVVKPNPASETAFILVTSTTANKAIMHLHTATGEVLMQKEVSLKPGQTTELNLPVGKYAPGLYYITLTSDDFSVSKKLLVVRSK